ncbi:protein FAM227A isoform X2 [Erythrolamprus reginae]|uniref:protein FAM227A isoform X2 n=1 Tax=Erythrolamprus reginae TaxID=121349 RepID=UPI00396C50F8
MMDLIHTKAFLSPLSGFLILPPSIQEDRRKNISCKLDDLPRLYVIGNVQTVNKKISELELGLRRYDSSDMVIEDMMQKKYAGPKGARKGKRLSSRVKEMDKAWTKRYGRLSSDAGILRNQKKMAQRKMITEKNKLVELYHYPGYREGELTPLPNGIELDEILEKVIRAQSKIVVGKTKWAVKMLHKFFDSPCSQAVLLDSFWWQFLHLYHPNREVQGYLFERIAENYALILLGNHRVSNQECILKFFPSLLSQAVYICFCSCFPRSLFNTSEFKAQICDVFFEWLGGMLQEPRGFYKWDYSQLEPERSRREDLMSRKKKIGTGTGISFESYKQHASTGKSRLHKIPARKIFKKSVKKGKKPASGKKDQKQLSQKVSTLESEEIKQKPSSSSQLQEDNEKAAWSRQQNLPQKKLKTTILPRESHPACHGPDFTWHRFNISGHSPLIQHYLQKRDAESKSGCDIFISRRMIYKPVPDSAKTYADVIEENYHILHQKHKAFKKYYWQQHREIRKFSEQYKCNQELYREAIKEEMKKKKAQKRKELLSLRHRQNSSEPSSLFSKVSSRKHHSFP